MIEESKKTKILIVEDEPDLLRIIETILLRRDVEVFKAADGSRAKEMINNNKFDLVISDYQLPKMTGLELFYWIKENHPTPFILMTGFSNIASTKESIEIGIDGFLPKPFNFADLNEVVNEVLSGKNIYSPELVQEKFHKIPIDHFFCDYEIPYKIYLKFSEGNFKKLAHTGESLDNERIENYKKKGIDYLYLKKEDFKKFIDFQLLITKNQFSHLNKNNFKKVELVNNVLQDLYEKAYVDGIDKELFDSCVNSINFALSTIANDENALYLIEALKEQTPPIYQHSISVCLISVAVAKKLGYTSTQELFNLSIAAFFHDIGESFAQAEMLNLSEEKLEALKQEIVGTHPEKGYQILSQIDDISQEVLNIVANHEDLYGTLKESEGLSKPSLAHIVAVVDKISYIESDNFLKAINEFENSQEYFSKDIILELKKIFADET